jgi:hypothetical protein
MVEIKDTYFRRLFVPIVISILMLCGAAVVIFVSPGTQVKWETSATALGVVKKGGFLKALRRG